MPERELKFHIPPARRDALTQAVTSLAPRQLQLLARYYDTAERELATSRVALRLRNEGGIWIQTAKAPGADALSRIELNETRPDDTLDLAVYKGTALHKPLSRVKHRLHVVYETDVTRLAVQIRHQDSVIELALDQGVLRSGGVALDIHELELELISGQVSDLFRLAEQWQQQFGLILELRSKAERGDRLATLVQAAGHHTPDLSGMIQVRRAGDIGFDAAHDLHSAFKVCAGDCLEQIIRNTASLAGIDSQYATQEQRIALVHQWRVGVRRLRSCWKLFKPWIPADTTQEAAELRRYFALFGEGRDHDVITHEITPKLMAAGMPDIAFPASDASDPQRPANLAASAGLQTILLRLLEQSLTAPEIDVRTEVGSKTKSARKSSAAATLLRRLNKWLNQIVQIGGQFDTLTPEERHDLRKKIKRLRYGFEFSHAVVETLHPAAIPTILTNIQRALGELNDLYTADAYYGHLTNQPGAWFALGWLRAMQAVTIQRVNILFSALANEGPLTLKDR